MGVFFFKPMTPHEISAAVQRKLDWILAACRPEAVILFGSAARGTMTERSDIDLALIFPDADTLRQARKAIFRQPPPDDRSQDLLFLTDADYRRKRATGGICEIIQAEGTPLFGSMP